MTGVEQGRNASRACRGVICVLACVCIVGGFAACGDENETQIVGVVSYEADFQLGQVPEVSGATIRLADGSEVQAEVDLAESDIPKLSDSSLRWRAEKRETGWVITGVE